MKNEITQIKYTPIPVPELSEYRMDYYELDENGEIVTKSFNYFEKVNSEYQAYKNLLEARINSALGE